MGPKFKIDKNVNFPSMRAEEPFHIHGCKNRLLLICLQWFKYDILYLFVIKMNKKWKGIHNTVINLGVDFKRETFYVNLHPFPLLEEKKVLNQIQEEPITQKDDMLLGTVVPLIL